MTDNGNSNGKDKPKKYSGVEGVFWNTRNHGFWQASLRSPAAGGRPTFLGTFPEDMLPLAKELIERAKEVPAETWPTLRAEYRERRDAVLLAQGRPLPQRAKRTRRPRKLTAQDKAEAEIAGPIKAARLADKRVAQAEGEMSRLARQAQDLMKAATGAWDAVAEALRAMGRDLCSGFHDSKLGVLLDRDLPLTTVRDLRRLGLKGQGDPREEAGEGESPWAARASLTGVRGEQEKVQTNKPKRGVAYDDDDERDDDDQSDQPVAALGFARRPGRQAI